MIKQLENEKEEKHSASARSENTTQITKTHIWIREFGIANLLYREVHIVLVRR